MKPASSASRMYAPRVMLHRYTPRDYNHLSRRAGPCGEAMPTRGRGEGQLTATSNGGGLAGCRCNIDETAVCFVLTRVLCVLFFFFPTDATGQRKKSSSCFGLWADTRISLHRTARPTHTLPIAPRWRRLTAFKTAAKAGKVMLRRVGRVQMQHR